MKKVLAVLTALSVLFLVVPSVASAEKLNIVATVFPLADWTREIVADNPDAEITLLLDKGVDLHSYQPTVQDMMKIASADVFIYVGGESDAWVADALSASAGPDMTVLDLMDLLGDAVKEEELVEGMEEEQEAPDAEAGEGPEMDEHIWLSLRNASALTQAITDALAVRDPAHADLYRQNAASYISRLTVLDERYQEEIGNADYRTLLFGDRFPFRYLADDYGLSYYAAFTGCSAESEASFETIVFLADKVNELDLPAVLTIEGANHRIAETVAAAAGKPGLKILTVNSLQGKPADGESYLSVMESNLEIFREALTK